MLCQILRSYSQVITWFYGIGDESCSYSLKLTESVFLAVLKFPHQKNVCGFDREK
ncbi:hypothetical protein Fmac_029992 [Flemingia macrophylla]|uniref:Uncharacterized protein n=1 Tax=Flemingia macrophylla TaxID=520843 RepID=A0ABD1LC67_9FABA